MPAVSELAGRDISDYIICYYTGYQSGNQSADYQSRKVIQHGFAQKSPRNEKLSCIVHYTAGYTDSRYRKQRIAETVVKRAQQKDNCQTQDASGESVKHCTHSGKNQSGQDNSDQSNTYGIFTVENVQGCHGDYVGQSDFDTRNSGK